MKETFGLERQIVSVPLSTKEFHCSNIENAFCLMSQANAYVGKIVITGLNDEKIVVAKRKAWSGSSHNWWSRRT